MKAFTSAPANRLCHTPSSRQFLPVSFSGVPYSVTACLPPRPCVVNDRVLDVLQALPLVSTFWGIFLFGEYRRSSPRTYVLLAGMLCAFAAAVGLLMGSAGTRKPGS